MTTPVSIVRPEPSRGAEAPLLHAITSGMVRKAQLGGGFRSRGGRGHTRFVLATFCGGRRTGCELGLYEVVEYRMTSQFDLEGDIRLDVLGEELLRLLTALPHLTYTDAVWSLVRNVDDESRLLLDQSVRPSPAWS